MRKRRKGAIFTAKALATHRRARANSLYCLKSVTLTAFGRTKGRKKTRRYNCKPVRRGRIGSFLGAYRAFQPGVL